MGQTVPSDTRARKLTYTLPVTPTPAGTQDPETRAPTQTPLATAPSTLDLQNTGALCLLRLIDFTKQSGSENSVLVRTSKGNHVTEGPRVTLNGREEYVI